MCMYVCYEYTAQAGAVIDRYVVISSRAFDA
jgi:hypothetical protein